MFNMEFSPPLAFRPTFLARRYAIVTGHYLATMAGLRILQSGGNVVDAGVAAGLCLNVVQPDMTNLGGVAPIILRTKRSRDVVTVSGLGWWPRDTTIDALETSSAAAGGLKWSIVPAAFDAWIRALDGYGTMPFAEVAAPSIELAKDGFPVTPFLHDNLSRNAKNIALWPSSRDVFLRHGSVPEVGRRLVQADLARTLMKLCEAESGAGTRHEGLRRVRQLFYRGEIAERIASFCQEMGGSLTLADLAEFESTVESSVGTVYRGYDVRACGPWCQGPVVPQTLNILEGYDMGSYPRGSTRSLHLLAESLKASFADRHAFYGDPRHIDVPIVGLLSKEYAATWRARIALDSAFPEMPAPGNPWLHQHGRGHSVPYTPVTPSVGPVPPDTSTVCVLDADGNAFSVTPSDGVLDTPVVTGLGFVISSRGSQSWLDPNHPSSVAPRKRPRLTPSPGLVLKGDHLFMAYGSPGHDVQPQAMVQLLINIIDYGMDVQEAIEAARIATASFPASTHPHPYRPGHLSVEARIPASVRDELGRRGHRIEVWPAWAPPAGGLAGIVLGDDGTLRAGADPRRMTYAAGW